MWAVLFLYCLWDKIEAPSIAPYLGFPCRERGGRTVVVTLSYSHSVNGI